MAIAAAVVVAFPLLLIVRPAEEAAIPERLCEKAMWS